MMKSSLGRGSIAIVLQYPALKCGELWVEVTLCEKKKWQLEGTTPILRP